MRALKCRQHYMSSLTNYLRTKPHHPLWLCAHLKLHRFLNFHMKVESKLHILEPMPQFALALQLAPSWGGDMTNRQKAVLLSWLKVDNNQDEWLLLIAYQCQKLWGIASFFWQRGTCGRQSDLWNERENQWIIYYVQSLMKRLCCVTESTAKKEVFRGPLLPLAWCHDQFDAQPSCPPILILGLMAFLTPATFGVHFIAVVCPLVDFFLTPLIHLSVFTF